MDFKFFNFVIDADIINDYSARKVLTKFGQIEVFYTSIYRNYSETFFSLVRSIICCIILLNIKNMDFSEFEFHTMRVVCYVHVHVEKQNLQLYVRRETKPN